MILSNGLFRFHMTFVLFFGLISCSSHTPQRKDDFKISPPRLNSLELGSKNDLPQKIVAMGSDQLVFDSSQLSGVRLSVEAECQWRDKFTRDIQDLEPGHSWSLLRLLPRPLLFLPRPSSESITCRFGFIATNAHESKHRFLVGPITIQNLNSGDLIGIEKTFDSLHVNDQIPQFTKGTWSEIHFTSDHGFSSAKLNCGHWSFPLPTRSTHRLQLSDLPLHLIRKTHRAHPLPYCRILALSHERITQISPLFQLRLYEPGLGITHNLTQQDASSPHPRRDWMSIYITNHDQRPWWILIPKGPTSQHPVHVVHLVGDSRTVFYAQMNFQLAPLGGDAALKEDSSHHYLYEMKADQKLTLGVRIPKMPSCSIPSHPGISGPMTIPLGLRLSPWVNGAPLIFNEDPRQGSDLKPEWPAGAIPLAPLSGLITFHPASEKMLLPSPLDTEHDGKGYCR